MSEWFALIDCAQDARLYQLVLQCRNRDCMFISPVDPAMVAASPYLVQIAENEPLLNIWRAHGAGQNWGILIESDQPLDRLRTHLRKFMQARLPDGQVVMFRFYDPRVLTTYFDVAPQDQVAKWFDGVRQYSLEAEGRDHAYRWRGGRLFDGDTPVGGMQ